MKANHGEIIEQLRDAIAELTSDGVEYTNADILAIFDRASVIVLVAAHRNTQKKSHHATQPVVESPQKKAARTRMRNKKKAQASQQRTPPMTLTPVGNSGSVAGHNGGTAVGE